jgi:hypothetical protein
VHVVQQHDDRRAGDQRAGERDAVLHVDDQPRAVPAHVGQAARVDAEPPAPPDEVHAAHHLVGGGAAVGRAEQPDPQAGGGQALGDPVHVLLRAAALRVPQVAPVEEQDVDLPRRLPVGRIAHTMQYYGT